MSQLSCRPLCEYVVLKSIEVHLHEITNRALYCNFCACLITYIVGARRKYRKHCFFLQTENTHTKRDFTKCIRKYCSPRIGVSNKMPCITDIG